MMKMGLAVCYDSKNYGSQLQVLATVYALHRLGIESEIIRYKKALTPAFILQTIPRLFNISFVKSKLKGNDRNIKAKKYPEIYESILIREKKFSKFADEFFTNLSPVFVGWEKLVKEAAVRYDGYLCGSDQLWLPNNLGSHFYTLEFAPDKKRKISYATSFGVSKIPSFQRKRTAHYLKRINYLSTREISGARIIKELTGIDAEVVCDPTLLLSKDDWKKIIPEKSIINKPYIFCYFLGTKIQHRILANDLKRITGYEIVNLPFMHEFVETDMEFGDYKLYNIDSCDFVNLIQNARYVLTDSFHGTVFSIIFHREFLTFDRFNEGADSRNSRIDSLFSLLGLEERRYNGSIEVALKPIDYEGVDIKLRSLRNKSTDYLKHAILD